MEFEEITLHMFLIQFVSDEARSNIGPPFPKPYVMAMRSKAKISIWAIFCERADMHRIVKFA